MKRTHMLFLAISLTILFSGCVNTMKSIQKGNDPSINVSNTDIVGLYCPTKDSTAAAMYNQAAILTAQNNINKAIDLYKNAIKRDQSYCDAMDNLGILLRRNGKLDEAEYWYRRSIDTNQTNPVPHINLGVILLYRGDTESARKEYEAVVDIDPSNPEGYYGLGNVCIGDAEFEQAIVYMKIAESLYLEKASPVVDDARVALGLAYFSLAKYDTAIQYLDQVYERRPNNPLINYMLGISHGHGTGEEDMQNARKYIGKAKNLGFKIPPDVADKYGL